MKPEVKKLILLNLPYLLFVYLFGKVGQAFRLAYGIDLSAKLLHIGQGFTAAFSSAAPSFHPIDLLAPYFAISFMLCILSIMPVFRFFSHRPEFSVVPCVKVQSADHEEHDTKRHPAPNKIFFCKQTRQQPGCRRINQREQSADHPETDTGTLQP